MRTIFSRAGIFAVSLCAMACARAELFNVATTPNPVAAGHAFSLTITGMMKLANAAPAPVVTVAGPIVTINLRRDCGFPACAVNFTTQIVAIPALAAGAYVAYIYEGPQVTASPDAQAVFVVAEPNYQGMWWNAPAGSEAGWGLAIDHQGSVLFAAWFTYDASGKAAWLVMPRADKTAPATFSGAVYRTTGPRFDASPWDPNAVDAEVAGSATLDFTSDRNGTFTYTIDGATHTKPITRQFFSTPVATCIATS